MFVDRPTFVRQIIAKIRFFFRKFVATITRKKQFTDSEKIIARNKKCRDNFQEFVNTLNQSPDYFLSQY